jgi:hypothetical protein
MPTTTPLQSIELTSDTGSVVFSNIDQSYTDLIVVCRSRTSASTSQDLIYRFNDDSATNYSQARMFSYAVGGAAWVTDRTSSRTSIGGAWSPGTNMSSANYGQTVFHINNYSNSTTYKTVLSNMDVYGDDNTVNSNNIAGKMVGQWRSTSAITSIVFYMASGNIVAGSTFDLYGIKSGTPKAFGGNSVQTDGTYWYHTFTSSGTFTPSQPLTTDYLVVAGGGGAGGTEQNATLSAPGGAGGLRSTVTATGGGGSLESAISLLSGTSYTVTIGAGGAGGAASPAYTHGSSGSDSVFGSITSLGGGGGGFASGGTAMNGYNGGSGGGGNGGGGASYGVGGSGTAGQGYAGGTGSNAFVSAYAFGAGGGGGAGAAGTNGSSTAGGNGGIGVQITALANITGTGASGYYAGGGGGGVNSSNPGGSGGAGGGGAGGTSGGQGVAGTANTGGGAGGSGTAGNFVGRSGGSGIVIVRYPV